MEVGRWLLEADRWLFQLINSTLAHASLNGFMLLIRQAYTWIPLYLFFLLFFIANTRKILLTIISLTLLTFAICDFTSAGIIKPLIGRLRPCHDQTLVFHINNIAGCGGIYSMPSSHATNHFGLATFWFLILRQTLNLRWHWLFAWAFFIGFAQVYVGVHYPADILTGALLGCSAGYFCWFLFNRWTREKAYTVS